MLASSTAELPVTASLWVSFTCLQWGIPPLGPLVDHFIWV